MSGKTWLAEFYPEEAAEAAKRGMIAAGEHCLQKWLGYTPEALKKHNLRFDKWIGGTILAYKDDVVIHAGPGACAYCQVPGNQLEGCKSCPLANVAPCCFVLNGPYQEFLSTLDPSGLIKALREALAWAQKSAK
jgi:hypothetical protein